MSYRSRPTIASQWANNTMECPRSSRYESSRIWDWHRIIVTILGGQVSLLYYRFNERERLTFLLWSLSLYHPAPSNAGTANLNNTKITKPAQWDLRDFDSVVLPVHEVSAYLEKALTSLGLYTEARASFITYVLIYCYSDLTWLFHHGLCRFWSPSFLKHNQIALRFIPQADYNRLAPLDINPEPDVVTRIFMLFKGVTDPEAWPCARRRARYDVSFWTHVVGVDAAAALNKELSRVLEWAAMEISS